MKGFGYLEMETGDIMRRCLGPALILLLPATALGQYFRPTGSSYLPPLPSPRVTPYIGLLRGGNPAANYYLSVQPEVRRALDAQLYGSPYLPSTLPGADPRTAEDAADLTSILIQPQSGHGAGFNLTGPFFQFPSRQRPYLPYNGREPGSLPAPAKKTAP